MSGWAWLGLVLFLVLVAGFVVLWTTAVNSWFSDEAIDAIFYGGLGLAVGYLLGSHGRRRRSPGDAGEVHIVHDDVQNPTATDRPPRRRNGGMDEFIRIVRSGRE